MVKETELKDTAGKSPVKKESMEVTRRKALQKKGSASASANFMAFIKDSKKEQDPEKKRAANRLLRRILCDQWYIVVFALPLSFLGAIQDFGTSHFIGRCIDALNKGEKDEFMSQLYAWLVVIGVGAVASAFRDWLYGLSSEKIGLDIRARFFEAIVRKDVGFYDDRKVGDILSRLTSDTQMVQMGLTTNVAMFLKSLFTIIGVYVVLFLYSWKITLIAIGFLIPLFLIMPLWSRLTQFTQKQYQEVKAECSSTANETIGNIKTVKAFSGEMIGVEAFNDSNIGIFNIGKNMAIYYASMMCCFQIFFNGAFLGVSWFSTDAVKSGELTQGEVAAYLLYNWQLIWNVLGLNQNL